MMSCINFLICFLLLFSPTSILGASDEDMSPTSTAAESRLGEDNLVTTVAPTAGDARGGNDHNGTTTPEGRAGSDESDDHTVTTTGKSENRAGGDADVSTTTSMDRQGDDADVSTTTPMDRQGDDADVSTTAPVVREGEDDDDDDHDDEDDDLEETTVSPGQHEEIEQRSHDRLPYVFCSEEMEAACPEDHECQVVVDIRTGEGKEFHCIHPKCTEERCSDHGHCVGSNECHCDKGFVGDDCSSEIRRAHDRNTGKQETESSDGCSDSSNPCPKNKRCVMKSGKATCLSYACKSHPCQNGGACQESDDEEGEFTCACGADFTGHTCGQHVEQAPNKCSKDLCKNGGKCHKNKGVVSCECKKGFEGEFCEMKSSDRGIEAGNTRSGTDWGQTNKGISSGFDRCAFAPNPCSAGKRCEMVDSRVVCTTQHCASVTCSGRGTCVEDRGGYRCICRPGYSGADCQSTNKIVTATPCNPNPCRGDCTCHESCQHEYGYFCASNGGYMGKNCTIPVPRIVCGQRSISVDIPEALYTEFDKGMRNTFFYVSQSANTKSLQCEATNVGGVFHFDIPLPFTGCGTSRGRTSNAVVIKNRVFIDRKSTLFSMAIPVIDFECRYERQYRLVTSLKPVVTQPELITKYGQFTPEVELCKVSSCQAQCPQKFQVKMGAVYTVGEKIHLSTTALPQNGFMDYLTTITEMRLSCSASSGTSAAGLGLIADGCPANSGLATTSNVGRRACVSFQTPRPLGCESVYIHLHLHLCNPSELQSCGGGMKRCGSALGRKRRSSVTADKDGYVVVGPLVIIEGSEGVEKMILYPEATVPGKAPIYVNELKMDKVSRPDNATTPMTTPISGGNNLTTIGILVPVAILVFFYILLMYAWQNSSSRLRSSFTTKKPLIRKPRLAFYSDSSDNSILYEVSHDDSSLATSPTVISSTTRIES